MTNAPSGTPQASYLAVTTVGLQGDAAMLMSLNDLAGPVEAELQTQRGLIGYQLGIRRDGDPRRGIRDVDDRRLGRPPTWAMARQQIADNGLFEGY